MRRQAVLLCACLPLVGCAVFGRSASGPEGMTAFDADLRQVARAADWERALELTDEGSGSDAGDDLLRILQRAAFLHFAGRYRESNQLLQDAEIEIDDRYTRSVSRAVASMLTNDRVLAWQPFRVERLMVHYYGALNYLALGDPSEAAVEARRLSALLEGSDDREYQPAELRFRRVLRYFAGSVFESAGEWDAAGVAYRNAWIGWDPTAPPVDPDTLSDGGAFARALAAVTPASIARGRPSADSAEIVLVVETGFIAHRNELVVPVPIFSNDRIAGSDEEKYDAAMCVAARSLGRTYWGPSDLGRCPATSGKELYVLTVAWPTLRRTSDGVTGGRLVTRRIEADRGMPVGPPDDVPDAVAAASEDAAAAADAVTVAVADSLPAPGADSLAALRTASRPARSPGAAAAPSGAPIRINADLSAAYAAEFNERLGGVVAKAIARGTTKYLVVDAAKKAAKKEDETLGVIVGLVGNVAAVASEQADLRSWHLLPGTLRIARARVSAGTHAVALELEQVGRREATRVEAGEVTLRPGQVAVVALRVWP